MPSTFMAKRNYLHCPIKKRPLAALYEQEEPEDLSVKRARFEPEDFNIKRARLEPENVVPKQEIVAPTSRYYPTSVLTPPHASSPPSNFSFTPQPVYAGIKREFPIHSPVSSGNNTVPQYHFPMQPSQQVMNPVLMNRHSLSASSYNMQVKPSSYSMQVKPRTFVPPVLSSSPSYTTMQVVTRPTPVVAKPIARLPVKSEPSPYPNLAEYYLQLFRATSKETESKKSEWTPTPHMPSHMPPSPQTSPNSQYSSLSPIYHHPYPESSALISPASSISTESEEELQLPSPTGSVSSGRSSGSKTRYTCTDCGKAYATKPGLAKHKELHCSVTIGVRAYSCPTCNKSYTSCGALKMHIRTHTLPCKCHVCGKAFSRPWLLQGHIRTHTGEKPFHCTDCDRSFADRSNLRAHQQTHATIKKYACVVCTKTFSRMSLLNKHKEGTCIPGCPSTEEEEDVDVVGNDWTS